ncbi:MAG: hypothetical protein ABIO24_10085 [Saprospiraceae bacterium]
MRNEKSFGTIFFLLILSSLSAQRINVLNASSGGSCPGTVEACVAANQVGLSVATALPGDAMNLPFDPNDGDPKRRFKAFWITGDGNFLEFADTPTDDGSRNPAPYNYVSAGNYQITTYLTGKYTNKNWPKRAAKTVRANASATSGATPFTTRLRSASQILDLTSNQAIRKKNLTAFVISYARAKQASGVYFFYNGATNTKTGIQKGLEVDLLNYANTEVPAYFPAKMDTSRIRSYATTTLRFPGTVDGLSFTAPFHSLSQKFRNLVYFPAETAQANDLPTGFTEKRFFPVLQADSTFTPTDTLLNFFVVLTGPEPGPNDTKLNALLSGLSQGLSTTTAINLNNQINRTNGTQSSVQQTPTGGGLQYIQAAVEYSLAYEVTFDPNQLTVDKITPLGSDNYEVHFRLEMCNKGQGNVQYEMVSIHYPANFQNFKPLSPTIKDTVHNGQNWAFKVDQPIPGVPAGSHESDCISVEFTAKTDCNGIRSLWKSNLVQPLEACVVFEGAIDSRPECNANFPIDSMQFQVDGQGICVSDNTACTWWDWGLWGLLLLLILLILLFLYRRFFRPAQP